MHDADSCNRKFRDYEEEYEGYFIYIERNPDPYREGYIWSVFDDSELYELDLDFSFKDSLTNAKKMIFDMLKDEKMMDIVNDE